MTPDIFPLTYRKGLNYWSIFTRQNVKLMTINMEMAEPEEIAKIIVTAVNQYTGGQNA